MNEAAENYLKAIYKLQGDSRKVSTSALAEYLGVAPPSATSMIGRLVESGFLRHDRYRGVELTETGARAALEVIRHHRLWELFLAEALNVPLEQVHGEAERLEHSLSDDLEEHLDRALGYPTLDPHGDPIPAKDGRMRPTSDDTLDTLAEGEQARVARIPDSDPALLRHLSSLELLPGHAVTVIRREPFGGPIYLDVADGEGQFSLDEPQVIGPELARRIFVDRLADPDVA
ncbi:MAG TPA: metal-dependent transcriptional regulator, partial [Chloroflexota bacterium]|nr:metal-dependent transcriptional regulator [Chloroflexota bacterium]